MIINLPSDVKWIINKLEEAGFEAYAVGGCVRDSYLGREPDDWDITTNAKPNEVKSLFHHTIDTGIKHGTVTVLKNHIGYEVTTYRIDGEYEDNRHPKEVTFTASLIEDLKRRDFTINAMAVNENGVVDKFDGLGDIEAGIIRCVGDAKERFSEDALRMMRAVRFSAQLGYSIEHSTRQAITELKDNLRDISAERINVELTKLITSPNPDHIRDCYELGITGVIMPEFDLCMKTTQNTPHHCFSVGEHTIKVLQEVEADKVLRFACLFHDMGKPHRKQTDINRRDHFHGHAVESAVIARNIMKRLKFDNDTLGKVEKLVLYHDDRFEPTNRSVRRAMNKVGTELFPMLLKIQRADVLGQSEYLRKDKLERLDRIEVIYKEILDKRQCVELKDLAISGSDIVGMGIAPGPQIGEILHRLLDIVIDDSECNNRSFLLRKAKEYVE